ncbi:MAG TPA: ABC transporter ATP-binding protein [Clostridiales bacterium]|jgi:ABC-2 type transport system ATP-binding protein|nr:ABC transporter ATP-binding protein [Clostridiales bacterium]
MSALVIKNLSKSYKGFKLDNISLTLPKGCILGLIGENGAGKSTTIKLILNTIRRDSGSIDVLGEDNKKNFEEKKEDIGVVLDEAYFPETFTVKHVNIVMKNTYKNWDQELFYRYIEKLSLPHDKAFKEFSRGMKMKLAIAAALSHKAKLLLLDEATSGLDPIARDEILNIINEFTRDENNSVLISSHILSDLEKICDYIAFLHKGKLVFCEEKDILLEKYGILKCSKSDFAAVSPEAVKGTRENSYCIEALVERAKVPFGFAVDRASIEDIIVFLAREGAKR